MENAKMSVDQTKLSLKMRCPNSATLLTDHIESKIRGKFGWTQIGAVNIPYIFRKDGKYCAVKIVETQLLKKYESLLHRDVYSCAKIKCWQMSAMEHKLFNEINLCHCDGQYGTYFTEADILIRLEDAEEFYNFLSDCFYILANQANVKKPKIDKCGFIKINKESIVPFTRVNSVIHLPLFYFEGELEDVAPHVVQIREWDLSYLKFCFKAQGIRNSLYDYDVCDVVNLEVIKTHFSADTNFEIYWPNEIVTGLLLTKSMPAEKPALVTCVLPRNGNYLIGGEIQKPNTIPKNFLSNCIGMPNYILTNRLAELNIQIQPLILSNKM